jgi:hypothetical protein
MAPYLRTFLALVAPFDRFAFERSEFARLPPGDYAFFNSNHIPDGTIQEIKFAVDSPLEGDGFDL